MKIPLNRRATEPVYLQIRDRISRLIQSGMLQPGDRLPSIRTLAEEAQVNKLTVIEAYSVLEADGLIYARPGSGYFVREESLSAIPQGISTFAPKQEVMIPEKGEMSYSEIYLASTYAQHQGDMVMLSSGFPCPVGLDDLQRIARRALKGVSEAMFNYNMPQGYPMLRKQIAQLLIQQGLDISPEHLIITNGSMQALSLSLSYYVRPGDWVVVESPTYHGTLAILQDLGARVIGIPVTQNGMNLELLEQYLHSHHPKLIYTISTLHNPTGITTAPSHRQQLFNLAAQYNCRVLEDNAYEGLSFEAVPPPIKALDRSDLVTYIGTFSKTLMPGLRIGYMVVTGKHFQALLERKLLHDLSSSTITQAIVSEYLASGHYRRHLAALRTINLQGRNAMLCALERFFPAEASWTIPNGGLFLWVKLPDGVPIQQICSEAATQKVMITPGSAFFPNQQGYPAMRLNFSQSLENIDKSIEILGRLIRR
ncbi:MAG TPA: PLP-dependent aminotransferase family protein [Crinalium sp.]